MIVGTKVIPHDKLRSACTSVEALRAYSLSLVPRCIQHITEIIENQKYIVAIEVRSIQSIPYKIRRDLYEGLIQGVSIRGTINTLIDIEDLLSFVDVNIVLKALFKEELKNIK